MINVKKLPSSYVGYLGLSVALWLAYVVLTFTAPVNEYTNTFNLEYSQLMLLKLSVVAPFFMIWVVGIFAATAITNYLNTIKGSPEEKGFGRIQQGVMVLLLGLTIGAVLGAIRPFILPDQDMKIMLAVTVRYVNVFMPLIAFGLFFDGATSLMRLAKKTGNTLSNLWPALLTVAVAVFYSWVIFSNPDRQFGVGPNQTGALYLTDTMIILTLMIPYIAMWTLGIFAAARLSDYSNSVLGTIYRSALSWFARGILFTILLSISFQALTLLNEYFAHAGLQAILIIVYVLLAAIAMGYVFLWLGARKLRLIETVV